MPAKSQSQRGLVFSKRDQYGSEAKTPKKWKWVWEEEWENKGKLPDKVSENYRAKFVNENYPLGAAEDPDAPWNEPEDKSSIELEFDGDNMYMVRRVPTGPEEYEDERAEIDPEAFEVMAAEKLGLDYDELYEKAEIIKIKDVIDLKRKYDIIGYKFETSHGSFEASTEELANLTDLF